MEKLTRVFSPASLRSSIFGNFSTFPEQAIAIYMKRRISRKTASQKRAGKKPRYLRFSAYRSSRRTDLDELEENGFETAFAAIGKRAAMNAINENKALGIPVTFWQDGWVVRRMPDGSIERVQQAIQVREKQFRKGTVLYVRKTH
jgi:hypothetical protein